MAHRKRNLIKPRTGAVRATSYDLPPEDFVFGGQVKERAVSSRPPDDHRPQLPTRHSIETDELRIPTATSHLRFPRVKSSWTTNGTSAECFTGYDSFKPSPSAKLMQDMVKVVSERASCRQLTRPPVPHPPTHHPPSSTGQATWPSS